MRKSAFIINGLIFIIILFPQIIIAKGQGFGRLPLKECWRLEKENISNVALASDNGNRVFVSFSDGSIDAIEKESGTSLWHSDLGGEIISPVIIDSEKIYISSQTTSSESSAGRNTTTLYIRALSINTGIVNWQKSFPSEEAQSKTYFLEDTGKLYIFTATGSLRIIDKKTGEMGLEKKLGFKISASPFFFGDLIYVGTSDKTLVSLSKEDVSQIDVTDLRNVLTVILASDKKELFLGDDSGNVSAVDPKGMDKHWKTWTGAGIVSFTKVPRGLLVSSLDNFVYLISEKNGKRLWKKRLSGRSIGQPLIKDGIAVFSTQGGTDAVFLDLKKGNSINQVSIQKENFFINNPVGLDDLIVFPTFKGLYAFGSEALCKKIKRPE